MPTQGKGKDITELTLPSSRGGLTRLEVRGEVCELIQSAIAATQS
jgi:hypothetical protein